MLSSRYAMNGRFLASQLASHPMAANNRLACLGRLVRWQLASRLVDGAWLTPWVNGTTLVMERGSWGATGNYYFGLLEFSEMSFILHALGPGDLFADVGANVGVYSILAASVGADVVAFEPVPATVRRLERAVSVNGFSERIRIAPVGVGGEPGFLRFTVGSDTNNRVAKESDLNDEVVAVKSVVLDGTLVDRTPRIMKIDVEGFETEVLRGAKRLLSDPMLEALIIETSGHGLHYGVGGDEVLAVLSRSGFQAMFYEPTTRRLSPASSSDRGANTIFVRDREKLQETLLGAPAFSLWSRVL